MIEDKKLVEALKGKKEEVMEDDIETLEDITLEDVMEDEQLVEYPDIQKEPYSEHSLITIDKEYEEEEDNLFEPIPTGFKQLDDILVGGLMPTNLYIFSGKPGIGKSTFCIQMMQQIAAQKHKVIYATSEMNKRVIMFKLYNLVFAINQAQRGYDLDDTFNINNLSIFEELIHKKFKDAKKKKLYEDIKNNYLKEFGKYIYIIKTKKTQEVIDIVKAHPDSVLISDFIQKLEPKRTYQSDKQKVDEVLKELDELKDDCKIPIIAISSLNRTGYNSNKQEKMSSLKESGDLESDATAIFEITQGDNDIPSDTLTKQISIKCAKNRFGELCDFKATYYPNYGIFTKFDKEKK